MALTKTELSKIADLFAKMDASDANAVAELFNKITRQNRNARNNAAKSQFKVGDRVTFMSKRGRIEGSIGKINKVNIKVNSNGTTWTVSPNLLSKV